MKYIRQHDERDCGAACLAMIANHYGLRMPISKFRELTKTDKIGTNIYGLVDAANQLGFESNALEGDYSSFMEALNSGEISLPIILHTITETNTLHFVVLNDYKNDCFRIFDPGRGIYRIKTEDFEQCWTGYIVTFEKTAHFKEEKQTSKGIKDLFSSYKKQLPKLCIVLMISLVISFIGIIGACVFQLIIDRFTVTSSSAANTVFSQIFAILKWNYTNIHIIFPSIIALYLLQAVIQIIRGYLLSQISRDIDIELTNSYYTHLLNLPVSSISVRQTGEYLSRFSDISIIREAIASISLTLILDTVMVIACGIILAFQNLLMFAVALIIVVLYAVIVLIYKKPTEIYNRKVMEDDAHINSYFKEAVDGIETVKSANAEDEVNEKLKQRFLNYAKDQFKAAMISFSQETITSAVQLIGTVIILWIGFVLSAAGKISIGSLMSFYVLLGYFIEPIKNLIELQPETQTAIIAADRLSDVLDLSLEQQENKLSMPDAVEKWAFENVDFRYGNHELLIENMSFQINRGEKVAFVGESGSGKTTVAKLLMRFYQPESGKILIDHCDLAELDSKKIREKIAYVDQKTFLFADTIRSNLKLGNPDVTDDEMVEACKKSMAHEFIMRMPLGYDTPLDEDGMNLSGGQRQRLAIARALLKKPQLLILDEATSNLDTITEAAIKDSVFSFSDEITCIIIAHRLNTIQQCDKIFLFENGKIVEEGTHEECMNANGKYAALWKNNA